MPNSREIAAAIVEDWFGPDGGPRMTHDSLEECIAVALQAEYQRGFERAREMAAQMMAQWFFPIVEDGSHERLGKSLAAAIRAIPYAEEDE